MSFQYIVEKKGSAGSFTPRGWDGAGSEEELVYLHAMNTKGWELVSVIKGRLGRVMMYYWKRELF